MPKVTVETGGTAEEVVSDCPRRIKESWLILGCFVKFDSGSRSTDV
jgi:hypothetical protein